MTFCQAVVRFVKWGFISGEPVTANIPREHWAVLGSKGKQVLIPQIDVFTQAVLREPGVWLFFLSLSA